MTQHTPTPWKLDGVIGIEGADGKLVGNALNPFFANQKQVKANIVPSVEAAQANAAFIVQAVNAHDALVEALRVLANAAAEGKVMHHISPEVLRANEALKLAGAS